MGMPVSTPRAKPDDWKLGTFVQQARFQAVSQGAIRIIQPAYGSTLNTILLIRVPSRLGQLCS